MSLFLTDTCPGIRPAVWHTPPVCGTLVGHLPPVSHSELPQLPGAMREDPVGKSREEQGRWDAQLSAAWKTSPCSLGRPGLSLSGCQHLKGKEEEGERGDRNIVEQEGASGCHQPVV